MAKQLVHHVKWVSLMVWLVHVWGCAPASHTPTPIPAATIAHLPTATRLAAPAHTVAAPIAFITTLTPPMATPTIRLAADMPIPTTPTRLLTATPIPATPTPLPTATPTPSTGAFRIVGRHNLDLHGSTGGLAIADHCAYVGTRANENALWVLDIAQPSKPLLASKVVLGDVGAPIELRALAELGLLLAITEGHNHLFVFDIHDCRAPQRLSAFTLLPSPHEFFVWHDPRQPRRVLVYVTLFNGYNGLQVIDLSEPQAPQLRLTWFMPNTTGLLHSISLADDGRRAYLSNWGGGLYVADTGELVDGIDNPQIRLLGVSSYERVSTHSAVRAPNRSLLVVTDEIYVCPFGWLRLVDIAEETDPHIVGEFRLPENADGTCDGSGLFSAHNPLPFRDFVLATWYSDGLVMVDITDATQPRLLAQYRTRSGEQFWSYPIVKNGLIYVVSLEGGLYVFTYEGPYAEQLYATKWAEGNVNCVASCGTISR